MTNTTIAQSFDALQSGRSSSLPFVDVFLPRDPTVYDVNYPTQKKWLNTVSEAFWILQGFSSSTGVVLADWQKIGSGSLFETLTGNSGGVVPPTANNLNVLGDGVYITTVGTPGSSTLTIEPAGGLTTLYTCNTGTASASAGNLNVFGTAGTTTTGSGNTITIKAEGALTWSSITASQTLVVNNGYFCVSPGGALALALPAASAVGDVIRIALNGATSWEITQGAGQQIRISNSQTTSGAGGSITSTGTGDTIELVCETANLIWVTLSYIGNLTVV